MATKPVEESSYVIATVRSPEGQSSGIIDGVIIDQIIEGGHPILDKQESERWAKAGKLWVRNPEGQDVKVLSIDDRYIRTAADKTTADNLKSLPIYDRTKKAYSEEPVVPQRRSKS